MALGQYTIHMASDAVDLGRNNVSQMCCVLQALVWVLSDSMMKQGILSPVE